MYYFDCTKIKRLRDYEGLTEKEFSKKLDVTEATVSRWENGERVPKVTYISTMCNVFKVSLDYFFTRC